MSAPNFSRLIQVCPTDHPPFADLIQAHRKAASALGLAGQDFFLGPPGGAPIAGAEYLGCVVRRSARRLARVLNRALPETADSLVICHGYRAWRSFWATGRPADQMLVVAHGYDFFARRRRLIERIRQVQGRLVGLAFGERRIPNGVRFAGVSPGVRADLEKTVANPLVWSNVLDLDAVSWQARIAARQALGMPESGFLLAFVGRLTDRKRPRLALAAFRQYLADGGEGHLAVVGDGAQREQLQVEARELPVTFAGFVPDIRGLMPAFDALLMTSVQEPFGMVLLEAMAAGVAVVAPRQPGPEMALASLGHYFERDDPATIAEALWSARRAPKAGGPERAASSFSVDSLSRRIQAFQHAGGGR